MVLDAGFSASVFRSFRLCLCVCVCIFTLLIAAFTPGSLVLYGKVLNARIKNGTGQVKIAFGRVTVSLIYS